MNISSAPQSNLPNHIFKYLENNHYRHLQHVLLKTAAKIEHLQRKFMEQFGISVGMYQCICQLAIAHPQSLTVKQIKHGITDANPDLNRMIDKLVKKGLIEKVNAKHNKRLYELCITESGLRLFEKIDAQFTEVDIHFYVYSQEECSYLIQLLNKLHTSIQTDSV